MARAALRLLVDLAICALAAFGAAAAFGLAAAFALLRSALPGGARGEAARVGRRARGALAFIYRHSGLPQALRAAGSALARVARRRGD